MFCFSSKFLPPLLFIGPTLFRRLGPALSVSRTILEDSGEGLPQTRTGLCKPVLITFIPLFQSGTWYILCPLGTWSPGDPLAQSWEALRLGRSPALFNQEPRVWRTTSVINTLLLIFILTIICTSKLLSSQRWSHIPWALDERLLMWARGPPAGHPLWREFTCSTTKYRDSLHIAGVFKMCSLSVTCHSWSTVTFHRDGPLWLY